MEGRRARYVFDVEADAETNEGRAQIGMLGTGLASRVLFRFDMMVAADEEETTETLLARGISAPECSLSASEAGVEGERRVT